MSFQNNNDNSKICNLQHLEQMNDLLKEVDSWDRIEYTKLFNRCLKALDGDLLAANTLCKKLYTPKKGSRHLLHMQDNLQITDNSYTVVDDTDTNYEFMSLLMEIDKTGYGSTACHTAINVCADLGFAITIFRSKPSSRLGATITPLDD